MSESPLEIELGSGNWVVSSWRIEHKECVGIFSYPNHGHPTDAPAPPPDMNKVKVVIMFSDLTAARMFQDQVNAAAMRMNGYNVT